MVEAVQTGTVVAAQAAAEARPSRGVPDAPAREKATPVRAATSVEAPDHGELQTTRTVSETTNKPQANITSRSSALTTYKDQESGRLIIRIFDKESGDILVEFPPEDPAFGVTVPPSLSPNKPNTNIEV